MQNPEYSNDPNDQYVRNQREAMNRHIVSKYENSIHSIKNQAFELKSKIERSNDKSFDQLDDPSVFNQHPKQVYSFDHTNYEINDLIQTNYALENELKYARVEMEKMNHEINRQTEQLNVINRRASVSKENISPNHPVERYLARIDFLEKQNGEYMERIARLENEFAIQKTQTNLPNTYENYTEGSDSHSAPYRRVQKLEVEKLKLIESNEYLTDKVNKLQAAYENMREQLDQNINKYESLLGKVKDNEDDKHKYVCHAKKLDEQLKSLNNNFVNLQKKSAALEKENKDLVDTLRAAENEKKNLTEKWLKMSKKVKIEETNRSSLKNIEQDLLEKTKEAEELRQKFASSNTDLQILRESERTYKEALDSKVRENKELQKKIESDFKDKEALLKQNLELVEKLEKIQTDSMSSVKRNDGMKEENSAQKQHINNLILTVKKLELEKNELNKRLLDSNTEIEKIYKRKTEIEQAYEKVKNDLQFSQTKWQLLVKEYEKLKADYTRVSEEKSKENDLFKTLQSTAPDEEHSRLNYEPSRDGYYISMKTEIDKIRKVNEQLYKSLNSALEQFICSVREEILTSEGNTRYNKLLVKYHQALERNKYLEKTNEKEKTDPVAIYDSFPNSQATSAARNEHRFVGFASIHRKRNESAEPKANHNDTIKLQKLNSNSNSNITPVKYVPTTQKSGYKPNSTDKNFDHINPPPKDSETKYISDLNYSDIMTNQSFDPTNPYRKSEAAMLEEELRNEINNTKSFKKNSSLEKMGLKKNPREIENIAERTNTPLGNDRYQRMLKNTLKSGQDTAERKRVSSSKRNDRSYQSIHMSKREDKLNQSVLVNTSLPNMSYLLNQSYQKNS